VACGDEQGHEELKANVLSFITTVQEPRFEDYDIVDKVPNQWKFLGNGKAKTHTLLKDGKADVEALTPYIRNAETAWEI
jgi:hypothetical protein